MRLIDADAFLKRNEIYADCEFIHPMYQNTLREIVDDEPTIDAVPVVHGEWIFQGTGGSMGTKTCSVCWYQSWQSKLRMSNMGNYCPNCGARMDGGEHDLR